MLLHLGTWTFVFLHVPFRSWFRLNLRTRPRDPWTLIVGPANFLDSTSDHFASRNMQRVSLWQPLLPRIFTAISMRHSTRPYEQVDARPATSNPQLLTGWESSGLPKYVRWASSPLPVRPRLTQDAVRACSWPLMPALESARVGIGQLATCGHGTPNSRF